MTLAAFAAAVTFAVSPAGTDAGPGTPEQPWRTLSHAVKAAPAGAIVEVASGTYRERVVIRRSDLTLRGRPGAVVSGVRLRGSGLAGLVHVTGRRVTVEGLAIRDLRGRRFVPAGVVVTGGARDVMLRGLDVSGIRNPRGDAHGIAVYGRRRTPITGVVIEGNTVHDLRLGSSEAVVVNGNVDGWRVEGNTVDDVDNIGIDAIGLEDTAPVDDVARNGVIARNVVTDVDTRGNPAYEPGCSCAGGIYVDGGRDIVIEENQVSRANIGIEVASEARGGVTADVTVRRNVLRANHRTGLALGGYDRRRGAAVRAVVEGNLLEGNDTRRTGSGELLLQFRVEDSTFSGNTVVAGPRGLLVASPFARLSGNTFTGNTWWTTASPRWQWRTRTYRTYERWAAATGETGGRFAAPDSRTRSGCGSTGGGPRCAS